MKKYLNKVKIVKHCDSIISEIPIFSILTVALFWSARQGEIQHCITLSKILSTQLQ